MGYVSLMSEHTFIADKSGKLGSRQRIIRNHYAYRVMLAMTGGKAICPSCLAVPFTAGTFEVDRTHGAESVDGRNAYTTGRMVYVCMGCNQGRAVLQTAGRDWGNVATYQALVAEASETVALSTYAEACEWWANREQGTETVSRFA